MSEQEINEAIAEACGRERNPDGGWYPDNGLRVGTQAIPDYCSDLNAMHEAEKVLTEKGVNAWWAYVAHINRNNPTPFRAESAVHATARQRAEAFIKTLNLEPK